MNSPFARSDRQRSRISPQDEQEAAKIAGLCDLYLREVGFVLVEVGSDYAVYENRTGYQVAIQGHLWFCKPPESKEFCGVGYVDLEDVVRGGSG